MNRFSLLIVGLIFLISACQQGTGLMAPAGPMGAVKPSETSSDPNGADGTDLSDVPGGKSDGIAGGSSKASPYGSYQAGGDGSGAGSGAGGSSTTIARIGGDPFSSPVESGDIECPEGADGGVYCPDGKARMMMYRSGQFSDGPRERLMEEVRFVRVVEIPAEVATNLNLTSADDFLQRVRLGAITDADAKAVTYRDVAVTVQADGTFAVPALKPGLSLVYERPAKAAETPQSFQSANEVQSTVANASYLAAFRSSVSDIKKVDPSLLMDVWGR